MPNYNQPHQFYAGVDLHARTSLSRCGTRPTPPTLGLAPRPVTEEPNIESEGVRPRWQPHRLEPTRQRLLRPDHRVKTN